LFETLHDGCRDIRRRTLVNEAPCSVQRTSGAISLNALAGLQRVAIQVTFQKSIYLF
jgi:hypothetical protein